MEKKTFKVPNIGCNGCVNTIKTELKTVAGVVTVEGAAASRTITIEYSEPANWETIRSKLIEIDYAPEMS
jgi:copper chaperone